MDRRGMEQRLQEAAMEGSVASLRRLLEEDPLILDRYTTLHSFAETPLHIAAMLGHHEFAKEILTWKPKLAGELDSWGSTPLHLASAKGFVEIVKDLVSVNPDMCFAVDRDGNNPSHVAAMRGHVGVLIELVRARPDAARARLDRGQTILHLCVHHNQLEALKLLVGSAGNHKDHFVSSEDDDGNTILHLAVADKQLEMVRFLLTIASVDVNATNALGLTAMDILAQSRRNIKDMDIVESLQSAGAMKSGCCNPLQTVNQSRKGKKLRSKEPSAKKIPKLDTKKQMKQDWVEKKKNTLMVVASLIATMGFQVGVNPPSGFWQETKDNQTVSASIYVDIRHSMYQMFLIYNTVGFIASLSVIFLLISGLPFKNRLLMWALMMIMWVAVTATAMTYVEAVLIILNGNDDLGVLQIASYVWLGMMALLFLAHTIRLTYLGAKKLFRLTLSISRKLREIHQKGREGSAFVQV